MITRYAQPAVARAVTVTTGALGGRAELMGAALAVRYTADPSGGP